MASPYIPPPVAPGAPLPPAASPTGGMGPPGGGFKTPTPPPAATAPPPSYVVPPGAPGGTPAPGGSLIDQLRSVTAWVNNYKANHAGQMPSDAELQAGTGNIGLAARQFITKMGGIPAGMNVETLYQQMATAWGGQVPQPDPPTGGTPAPGTPAPPAGAAPPAAGTPAPGTGPTDYGFFGPAGSPYGDPGSALGAINPADAAAWGALTGYDIYGNKTAGQKNVEFGQGITAAGLTGTYNGADTLPMLQKKAQDLMDEANRAKMAGDSARADQYQKLAQQTQDQAHALSTQKQTAELTGYTDAGGGGQQLTAAQRQYYITTFGYDPGPTAAGIQTGGAGGGTTSTLAGRAQTQAELDAERRWQFEQAQMAANPANAATYAAFKGVAPWQTQAQGGQQRPQTYQSRVESERDALIQGHGRPGGQSQPGEQTYGSVGRGITSPAIQAQQGSQQQAMMKWQQAQGGQQQGRPGGQGAQPTWQSAMAGGQRQAGTAEQNSPDWQRAGIADPRSMSAQSYDQMNESQKAAFGSFAKAAGGSTGDYEKQLATYRPQKTQATQGQWD